MDANELIHQADLAVYRAKLQGRNRVLGASAEPLLMPAERQSRLVAVPEDGEHREPLPAAPRRGPPASGAIRARTRSTGRGSSRSPTRLSILVGTVSVGGVVGGSLGAFFGTSTDWIGLLAVVALVGVGQALALEVDGPGHALGLRRRHARRRRALRARAALRSP